MDPLSHAIVGGTAAAIVCRKPKLVRAAIVCGVIAGIAPDLDVLLKIEGNPMFALKYHRHFTHSLAFVPIGALLIAGLLWQLLRKTMPFRSIYLFCVAGMAMHGPLDAMTNYGTHLFWPFTNDRESWNIISIIDPIFTPTLLVILLTAVIKRAPRYAIIGGVFALSYWTAGLYQREQATQAMLALAAERNHAIERAEVKPAIGNIMVWRAQYLHAGDIYYDAYHTSPWRGDVIYKGGRVPLFTPPADIPPPQNQDVAYFTFFSDGWLALAPGDKTLIGDMRFSMLPNQSGPIWGIKLQPDYPNTHVIFENVRTRTTGDLAILWSMIQGQPLPK